MKSKSQLQDITNNKRQMDIQVVLSLVLIGVLAGILSGLVGVGGGVVMVPLLVLLLGFNQHQAQGTSLAVLVVPVTQKYSLNIMSGSTLTESCTVVQFSHRITSSGI